MKEISVEAYTPCPASFTDHIYKTIHGVDLSLRVWPAPTSSNPSGGYLLWFHGGGFVAGKHTRPNLWVVPSFHARGIHVVSVAYRKSPQVTLADSVQDLTDGFAWCRANLADVVGGVIDVDRYAVGGDSAGGTLSTLAGHKFTPPPKVIVDVCGVTDFLLKSGPRDIPFENIPVTGKYTEAEIIAAAHDRDPAHAVTQSVFKWDLDRAQTEERLAAFLGLPGYKYSEAEYLRSDLFLYGAIRGELESWLFRKDEGDEDAYLARMRNLSSFHLLEGKTTYPATYFLHGTADTLVPLEQSTKMAQRLKEIGVPIGEGFMEGAGHVFEEFTESPDDPVWTGYLNPCMDFVVEHL